MQRLRSALDAVFDDPELEGLSSADLQGAYPAVQYGPPGVDFTIDVVSRLGEAYTFDDLELARASGPASWSSGWSRSVRCMR